MTLEEAYMRRHQQCKALQRENSILSDTVSGQFLSEAYAKYFANIRTYIETCVRNGVNESQALLRLTQNNPYTLKELFGSA